MNKIGVLICRNSPSMESFSMALRSPRLLWGGRVNPFTLRPVRTRLDST